MCTQCQLQFIWTWNLVWTRTCSANWMHSSYFQVLCLELVPHQESDSLQAMETVLDWPKSMGGCRRIFFLALFERTNASAEVFFFFFMENGDINVWSPPISREQETFLDESRWMMHWARRNANLIGRMSQLNIETCQSLTGLFVKV